MWQRRKQYLQKIERKYRPAQTEYVRGFLDWTAHTINNPGKSSEYWSGTILAVRMQVDRELKWLTE